jgi:hypothetical protein
MVLKTGQFCFSPVHRRPLNFPTIIVHEEHQK